MPRAKKSAAADNAFPTLEQEYSPAVSIACLLPHPENPNEGDFGTVDESMATTGWFGAVVAQKDREGPGRHRILAGHTRVHVAESKGRVAVPVLLVTCDDAAARRILLADNRTAEKGQRNIGKVADLLQAILADGEVLAGTGYDDDDLGVMLRALEGPPQDPDASPADGREPGAGDDPERDPYQEQHGVIVLCTSGEHQQNVYEELLAKGYDCRIVTT